MANCIVQRAGGGGGALGAYIDLGTGTSFDIKTLAPSVDYTTLTVDNFACINFSYREATGGTCARGSSGGGGGSFTKSYDATTGVLTFNFKAKFYTNGKWDSGSGWWDGTGPYYATQSVHAILVGDPS